MSASKSPKNARRQLMAGQTAQLLILVDGSQASVAAEAVNVSNAIALRESLSQILRMLAPRRVASGSDVQPRHAPCLTFSSLACSSSCVK